MKPYFVDVRGPYAYRNSHEVWTFHVHVNSAAEKCNEVKRIIESAMADYFSHDPQCLRHKTLLNGNHECALCVAEDETLDVTGIEDCRENG